jgi:high-affinity iron transporter
MVTYMVLWMRRHARDLKGDLEKAAGSALAEGSSKAVVIGYGIYKGGVHINLSRFFRITGVALVVIAAGLVMTGVHTANEAGWLNFGQTQALDLSWLVRPGTPLESFVTGVFGIQPYPVDVEFVAWVAYLIPMLVVMFWPSRQRSRPVPVVADPVESGSRRAERASLPAV